MLQLVNRIKVNWALLYKRVSKVLKQDIWDIHHKDQSPPKRILFYLLRIGSLVNDGFNRNNVFVRGASLSYSSLLSLGPLAAIVLLVAGFLLESVDQEKLVDLIETTITIAAPPLAEYLTSTQGEGNAEQFYEKAISTLNTFIEHARSSAVGVIGLLILGLIAIQLFTAIEKSFNDIWGVRRGRSWIKRIGYYWAFLTLGSLLTLTGLAIQSAGIIEKFVGDLPLGHQVIGLTVSMTPLILFAFIVLALAFFYKLIPNTQVNFVPAITGAIVVAALLLANNYLSFLYIKQVLRAQSLYGSLGIISILMLALYIFWVFILIGGQITYAIQNTDYLANQEAWDNTSNSTRQTLSLATLVVIARRFMECKPAYTSAELGEKLRVPGKILNETLLLLCDINLITAAHIEKESGKHTICYQPAQPLKSITLYKFKKAWEEYGNTVGKDLIIKVDPLVKEFADSLESDYKENWDSINLEDLLIKDENRA